MAPEEDKPSKGAVNRDNAVNSGAATEVGSATMAEEKGHRSRPSQRTSLEKKKGWVTSVSANTRTVAMQLISARTPLKKSFGTQVHASNHQEISTD